jgi:hypothetical protein
VVGQPDGTPNKAETLASANLLLAALRRYYSREEFTYHRHSEFMQTSCGDDIHFEDYPQDDAPICPECPECPDPEPEGVLVMRGDLENWGCGRTRPRRDRGVPGRR